MTGSQTNQVAASLHNAMRNERDAAQALVALFHPVHRAGIDRSLDELQHMLAGLARIAGPGIDQQAIATAASRYLQAHAVTQTARADTMEA